MVADKIDLWLLIFALFFFGGSILVFTIGWLAETRNKRRRKEKCKQIEQEMIEREKIERSKWAPEDWDREINDKRGGQTKK